MPCLLHIFIPFKRHIYLKQGSQFLFCLGHGLLVLFFNVWVKLKFLLLTLTWQTSSTFNVCIKTLNELCISKTLLLFRISLLKCFIYRSVYTSKFLHGATIPVTITKNQIKTILFISSRKRYLPLKWYTAWKQEKSCLPNWLRTFHMLVEKMLLPVAHVPERTFIGL